jgi:hypothetical protein
VISKTRSGSTPPGNGKQWTRIVDAVDVEPRFGEEMRVPSLAARNVEYSRPGRKAEQLDQPGNVAPIALRCEDWLVLEEILGVEVGPPPIGGWG